MFRKSPDLRRTFAQSWFCGEQTTAEKSESKARSGFEREKLLPSFPKGKANSGLSFKSDRFLRSKNRAWSENQSTNSNSISEKTTMSPCLAPAARRRSMTPKVRSWRWK